MFTDGYNVTFVNIPFLMPRVLIGIKKSNIELQIQGVGRMDGAQTLLGLGMC